MNHEKTLEKNSRLESDGEEEMNGGKRRTRNEKRKQKNIKSLQVALKVEVYMHPVSFEDDVKSEFSFLIDSSLFLGSAMVRSSSSLCSYCYCINGS